MNKHLPSPSSVRSAARYSDRYGSLRVPDYHLGFVFWKLLPRRYSGRDAKRFGKSSVLVHVHTHVHSTNYIFTTRGEASAILRILRLRILRPLRRTRPPRPRRTRCRRPPHRTPRRTRRRPKCSEPSPRRIGRGRSRFARVLNTRTTHQTGHTARNSTTRNTAVGFRTRGSRLLGQSGL